MYLAATNSTLGWPGLKPGLTAWRGATLTTALPTSQNVNRLPAVDKVNL